jgi:quercetin 2,3-dioxygenase
MRKIEGCPDKKKKIKMVKKNLLFLVAMVFFTGCQAQNNNMESNIKKQNMQYIFHPAQERGKSNLGWLQSNFSFSFANYYDPKKMNFGVLRVLNDDIIAPGTGFGMHPHDNMEIVTVVLDGAVAHKDNQGNSGITKSGEVQMMSAGTGVQHSEFNASKTDTLKLLQLWIYPNQRNVKPRYAQRTFEKIASNSFQTLIHPTDEKAMPTYQNTIFSRGKLDAGTKTDYGVQFAGNGVYVFVIEGEAEINGIKLSKRDAIGIWQTDKISVNSLSESDILLVEVPMSLENEVGQED